MADPQGESRVRLKQAVRRHRALSREGLLESMFERLFRGLVYTQIWEDPEIDLEALALGPDCHVVAIASGGCNVLSYLTADPARITAVDLSLAHVALNRRIGPDGESQSKPSFASSNADCIDRTPRVEHHAIERDLQIAREHG